MTPRIEKRILDKVCEWVMEKVERDEDGSFVSSGPRTKFVEYIYNSFLTPDERDYENPYHGLQFHKLEEGLLWRLVNAKVRRLTPHLLLMGVIVPKQKQARISLVWPFPNIMDAYVDLHSPDSLKELLGVSKLILGARMDVQPNVIDAGKVARSGVPISEVDKSVEFCAGYHKRLKFSKNITIVKNTQGEEVFTSVPRKMREGYRLFVEAAEKKQASRRSGKSASSSSDNSEEYSEDSDDNVDESPSPEEEKREYVRGIRKKKRWTKRETKTLISIVNIVGLDVLQPWRDIIKDYDFEHDRCLLSRTNVDLKDKWRNLVKTGVVDP